MKTLRISQNPTPRHTYFVSYRRPEICLRSHWSQWKFWPSLRET